MPPSRAGSLALIGGRLCLDFTNTTSGRGTDQRLEHLRSYGDLLAWSRHAGILDEATRAEVEREAHARPAEAQRAFDGAVALRDALYEIFVARVQGQAPAAGALDRFNADLGAALSRLRLRVAADGIHWDWAAEGAALDRMLWPIARSAAELLTDPLLDRVRQCPGCGCGWLFLDLSKNRSRRWCEMEVCGSRAKARRHYERKRDEQRRAGHSAKRDRGAAGS